LGSPTPPIWTDLDPVPGGQDGLTFADRATSQRMSVSLTVQAAEPPHRYHETHAQGWDAHWPGCRATPQRGPEAAVPTSGYGADIMARFERSPSLLDSPVMCAVVRLW